MEIASDAMIPLEIISCRRSANAERLDSVADVINVSRKPAMYKNSRRISLSARAEFTSQSVSRQTRAVNYHR